jgi:hypothetical protein
MKRPGTAFCLKPNGNERLTMLRFTIPCRDWLPFVASMLLGAVSVTGQIRPTDPLERAWLELLSRPIQGTSICNLPKSLRFGLEGLPFDYMTALKSGAACYVLLDGTDHVYRLEKDVQGPYLKRIDSATHLGGNYRNMPFLRHDTLYRFGGYGFWKTRGYFTWFNPSDGQWQIWEDDASLPSAYSFYWYDVDEDAFYLLGTWENRPHEHFRDIRRDSLFRYDFHTRIWKSLGGFDKSKHDDVMLSRVNRYEITTASFGLVTISGPLVSWIHFPTHSLSSIHPQQMQHLEALKRLHEEFTVNPDKVGYIIMGDSLFTVIGGGLPVKIHRLPMQKGFFEASSRRSLLDRDTAGSGNTEGMGGSNRWMVLLLATLGIGSASFIMSRRMRDSFKVEVHAHRGPHQARTADTALSSEKPQEAMRHFLSCLKPSDRRLLEFLLQKSLDEVTVRTEDVNRHLGLGQRSDELKKVSRNKSIQSINQVFQSTNKTDEDLIERFRDPDDKRVVNYRIHPAYAARLQQWMRYGRHPFEE